MTDILLYLLYAFVQGIVIVRYTNSPKEIIEEGAGGEVLIYMLFAPLMSLFILAYAFAYFVRWLTVVGRKP